MTIRSLADGHDHGARRRQQGQDVELGPVEALPAQVAVRRSGRRGRRRSLTRSMKKTLKPSKTMALPTIEAGLAWSPTSVPQPRPTRPRAARPTIDGEQHPQAPAGTAWAAAPTAIRITSAPPIRISSGRMLRYSTGMCSDLAAVHMPWTPRRVRRRTRPPGRWSSGRARPGPTQAGHQGDQRRRIDADAVAAAAVAAGGAPSATAPARRRRRPGRPRRPGPGPWPGRAAPGRRAATWAIRWLTDGLDAVEHRLRVDAEEDDARSAAAP